MRIFSKPHSDHIDLVNIARFVLNVQKSAYEVNSSNYLRKSLGGKLLAIAEYESMKS